MKGEAAALSVRAQHCQSHYFSTTPRTHPQQVCKYLFSDHTLLRTNEREEQLQHSVAVFILFYKLLLDKT